MEKSFENLGWLSVQSQTLHFFKNLEHRICLISNEVATYEAQDENTRRIITPAISRYTTIVFRHELFLYISSLEQILTSHSDRALSEKEKTWIVKAILKQMHGYIYSNIIGEPLDDKFIGNSLQLKVPIKRQSIARSLFKSDSLKSFDDLRPRIITSFTSIRLYLNNDAPKFARTISDFITKNRSFNIDSEYETAFEPTEYELTLNDIVEGPRDTRYQKAVWEDVSFWEACFDFWRDLCSSGEGSDVAADGARRGGGSGGIEAVDPTSSVIGFRAAYDSMENYYSSSSPETFNWSLHGKRNAINALSYDFGAKPFYDSSLERKSQILKKAANSNDVSQWQAALDKVGYTENRIPGSASKNASGYYFTGGIISTLYTAKRAFR